MIGCSSTMGSTMGGLFVVMNDDTAGVYSTAYTSCSCPTSGCVPGCVPKVSYVVTVPSPARPHPSERCQWRTMRVEPMPRICNVPPRRTPRHSYVVSHRSRQVRLYA